MSRKCLENVNVDSNEDEVASHSMIAVADHEVDVKLVGKVGDHHGNDELKVGLIFNVISNLENVSEGLKVVHEIVKNHLVLHKIQIHDVPRKVVRKRSGKINIE